MVTWWNTRVVGRTACVEGTPKTHRGRSMWRSEDRVINAWRMVAVGWGAGVRGEAASER